MQFKQIKETCIYCKDLKKAKEFYDGLLKLPVISYLPDKHIFFRVGSSVLLCFNPDDSRQKVSPPAHYGSGKPHFAFEVFPEEYEATKNEIMALGITITDRVIWESGQESFYFEDPEGNVLEVVPVGIWN